MNNSRLRHVLLRDASWIAAGQFVATVAQFIGMRVLTGLVELPVFGVVSLLLGGVTLLSSTLCTPFSRAILRFYAEVQQAGDVYLLRISVGRVLMKTAILSGVIMVSGGFLYVTLVHASLLLIPLLVILLLVDVVRTTEVTFLTAARRQRAMSIWTTADAVARYCGAIVSVYLFGPSTIAILLGYSIGAGLSLGICLVAMAREGERPPLSDCPEQQEEALSQLTRQISKYALPLVPSSLVSWVSSLSDRYIIGGLLGTGAAGLYAAGYGLVSRPLLMIGTVVLTTMRPIYFEAVAAGNRPLESISLRSWLALTLGIGVSALVVIVLASRELCHLALGPEYQSAATILPWIAMGYLLVPLSHIFNTTSLAYKQTSSVLASELTGAIASVAVGVPLTWSHGIQGAAMAVPIAFAMQLAVAIFLARPFLSFRNSKKA